jgi:hypothetical protein
VSKRGALNLPCHAHITGTALLHMQPRRRRARSPKHCSFVWQQQWVNVLVSQQQDVKQILPRAAMKRLAAEHQCAGVLPCHIRWADDLHKSAPHQALRRCRPRRAAAADEQQLLRERHDEIVPQPAVLQRRHLRHLWAAEQKPPTPGRRAVSRQQVAAARLAPMPPHRSNCTCALPAAWM